MVRLPLNGATARCLIDEALRHQGDLIKKGSRCRDTLYQVLGTFVLASEDIKIIGLAVSGDFQHVRKFSGDVVDPVIPAAGQHQLEVLQHISLEGADRLPRHDEVLAVIL